ncbi:N-acetylmuramoyl-L-alanine amidase [Nonomuraea sp. NPDC002799]
MPARFRRSAALLTGALIPLTLLAGQQPAAASAPGPVAAAFAKAAGTYEVPRDLLVSLAYAETHLDGHRGEPSASGGYGVMHLVTARTLERAATLTKRPVSALKTDDAANITGGAAVLRAYADELELSAADRKDPGQWYEAVAKYGNASSPDVARLYADAVYELLAKGIRGATPAGESITAPARAVVPDLGRYAEEGPSTLAASTDYPSATWVAANSGNYAVSSRPTSDTIDRIVIHVTQGSYAGTISWFQNAAANVSSHYVVRSSDGAITQMVREKDRAFHAGDYNRRSVGIEHEGFVNNASWFTDAMYRSSAALTRNIADRYGIPKDRTHIVGHNQVPGTDHTDPGSYWNWTTYMGYVTGGSGGGTTNPHTPESVCGTGYKVIDSAALGTAGTVYLLYNTGNGNNCVATIKKTSIGKASATSAYLEVQGKTRVTDSGNFAYFAGPVRAAAADKCVKWGGKVGTATYDSPFEHCG